jgi:hypothetical protein
MTNEPVRVVFHLDPNAALVGVLRGTVQLQAAHVGFDADTCAEIARASEDVCRETASKLKNGDSGLDVTLDTFADRIEVSIQHPCQSAPPVGLDAFSLGNTPAEGTGGINGLELLSRVDRVLYKTEDGMGRTTLVKFLKPRV